MSPFFRRRRSGPPAAPTDGRTRVMRAEGPVPGRRTEVVDEQIPVERRPRDPLWPWLLLLLLLVLAGLGALWYFSRDEAKSTVPNVVGDRVGEATRRVEDANLEPRLVREASERPVGVVFGTRPGAGSQLNEGEAVMLLVSSGPEQVEVPGVVGSALDDARARLVEARLEVTVRRVFSDEPEGSVVAQNPGTGERVASGSTVRINVSKGTGRVTVPDLVGLTRTEATGRLRRDGLEAKAFDVPSSEAEGTVIAQNPPPGDQAARGDTVRINVSTGEDEGTGTGTTTEPTATDATGGETPQPATATVPQTVGRNLAAAQGTLRDAGFAVLVDYVSSSEAEGRVVRQTPAAGTRARSGATVILRVSQGSQPRPARAVPDVAGLTEAEARTQLRAAGFRVQVFTAPTPDPSEEGLVIRQTPAAGRRVSAGSTVTIYVGEPAG